MFNFENDEHGYKVISSNDKNNGFKIITSDDKISEGKTTIEENQNNSYNHNTNNFKSIISFIGALLVFVVTAVGFYGVFFSDKLISVSTISLSPYTYKYKICAPDNSESFFVTKTGTDTFEFGIYKDGTFSGTLTENISDYSFKKDLKENESEYIEVKGVEKIKRISIFGIFEYDKTMENSTEKIMHVKNNFNVEKLTDGDIYKK